MLVSAFCVQILTFIIVISWISFSKVTSYFDSIAKILSAAILLIGVGLIGIWIWPPISGYFLFLGLFFLISVLRLRKTHDGQGRFLRSFFQWPKMLAGFLGVCLIASGLKGRLTPAGDFIALSSPLAKNEQHCVMSGGASLGVNLHYIVGINGATNEEVHSLDFIKLNGGGFRTAESKLLHPKPRKPEDYAIYGSRIFAPCDGTVVGLETKMRDQLAGHLYRSRDGSNHVTLNCSGTHVMLAHMQYDSSNLSIGDIVKAGDTIGLVGNTGNTEEPHLHIHAFKVPQDGNSNDAPRPAMIKFNEKYMSRGDCL